VLRAIYLKSLQRREAQANTLRKTVLRLLEILVPLKELVEWAVAAGHHEKSVRKLLSEILCAAGLRRRRVGGGRKPDPLAIAVLDELTARYGFPRTRKLIWAMKRAADERVATLCQQEQKRQEAA